MQVSTSRRSGTLPFGSIQGLLALPGAPGTLLVYGYEGIARSSDGGCTGTLFWVAIMPFLV